MEYIFRRAEIHELKEITALYQKAIANMNQDHIFQWDEIYPNEELLAEDIRKGEMFVLTDENSILSCVVINEEQDEAYLTGEWKYNCGRIAVIHRLCVKTSSQGEGLGRKTMQGAEEWIKKNGCSIIRMDTFSENLPARHLYESLGYTYAGEVTFRKGQFLLMEKSTCLKGE